MVLPSAFCQCRLQAAFALIFLLTLLLLSGCGDSQESNLAWEQTKNTNTKQSYLDFAKKYPAHSKTKEAISTSQDFNISVVEKAPAALNWRSLSGKELTFVFVDVVARWPNTIGNGKPENIFAVFNGDKKSRLVAVIHWTSDKMEIDMKGSMGQMNGGADVYSEPLKKYPGYPVKFPSDKGWFIYSFKQGGRIRLGLFFEGKASELKSINLFGQLVNVADSISAENR